MATAERWTGRDLESLDELLDEETVHPGPRFLLLQDLLKQPDLLTPPRVVLPRFAWAGRVTMLAGAEKVGKSSKMRQAAASLSNGTEHLGEPTVPSGVLWLALDEPLGDVVRGLSDHGATEGIVICEERPTFDAIEEAIERHFIRLLVVDTVTEFTSGLIENANLPEQWTPILRQFRQIARRTGAGIVLLHHVNRSTGKYRGSGQLGAGVDVVLEMTEHESDPTVRKVRARGRVPVGDFTMRYVNGRYELEEGGLTLEMRVYRAVASNPGIGMARLREVVGGKASDCDGAVRDLLRRLAVEDRGSTGGHAYHVRPLSSESGPGQPPGQPCQGLPNDEGQRGTGPGQPLGQPSLSHPLKGGEWDRVNGGIPTCSFHNIPQRKTDRGMWRCPACSPGTRFLNG
jgi:hypothetical protein